MGEAKRRPSACPTQTNVAKRFKGTRVIGTYLFQEFAAGSDLGVFAILHLALRNRSGSVVLVAPGTVLQDVPAGPPTRCRPGRYIRMPALEAGRRLVSKYVRACVTLGSLAQVR